MWLRNIGSFWGWRMITVKNLTKIQSPHQIYPVSVVSPSIFPFFLFLWWGVSQIKLLIMLINSFSGNGWPMKRVKPYFQPRLLSEVLTIANFHIASRIWTCAEPEFRLCWMKLCIVVTIKPWFDDEGCGYAPSLPVHKIFPMGNSVLA